jgi:D-alanyl-lipoteichoic acid acyltransferase DltB (MBOAT superfamily)
MNQEDSEHLRLLAIFHYIVAGIAALFSCFPILYLAFGVLMLSGAVTERNPADEKVATVVGVFIIALSVVAIVVALAFSILLILSGTYLRRHVNYTFCLAMAGVACVFMPFGTVLGVFTILVLVRPSVKSAFGVSPTHDTA